MGAELITGRPDGHQQGELRARDGMVIPLRFWSRPAPVAVVCHLHGQGEHSGPFTAMGDLLAEQGFAVYAHDQRGFGRSAAPRGDIGSFDHFITDALAVLALARREYPGRPVYLLGLSMGGHIALRTAVRAGSGITGVVAMSPGFRLRQTPPWSAILRTGWYLLTRPGQLMPSVIEGVATTRNARHLERALADDSFVRGFTARFYLQTVLSTRRAWHEMPRLQVPTLVVAGAEDPLIDPDAAHRYFDRIRAADKQFHLLPGVYHNLPAEPNMPEIAGLITAWMRERCAGGQGC